MPIAEVLDIGIAPSAALDNAHRNGFLHRDLKPANVALTADGHPKILDFGLTRLLSQAGKSLTQTGLVMGSVPYMAPEQQLGEPDDARTDVCALGVMLFEMITGCRESNSHPRRRNGVALNANGAGGRLLTRLCSRTFSRNSERTNQNFSNAA